LPRQNRAKNRTVTAPAVAAVTKKAGLWSRLAASGSSYIDCWWIWKGRYEETRMQDCRANPGSVGLDRKDCDEKGTTDDCQITSVRNYSDESLVLLLKRQQ
jgi:hypothetical protein